MLVDDLQERADSIKLVEHKQLEFVWVNNKPTLQVLGHNDGSLIIKERLEMSEQAFDDLLNTLTIPIKYAKRCFGSSNGGKIIGETNINFWLKQININLMLENNYVTQVGSSKRTYLAAVEVNDLIVENLHDPVVQSGFVRNDLFHAIYTSSEQIDEYTIGLRVLYSDSFSVPPRFDGLLLDDTGVLFWPVQGRKFRTANIDEEILRQQIIEFIWLAREHTIRDVVGYLNDETKINGMEYIYKLKDSLRISQQEANYFLKKVYDTEYRILDLVKMLSLIALDYPDPVVAREIQVSSTKFVLEHKFK